MQKLKKFLSPRKISIILSILILVISISFINLPAQSATEGIVTLMAVDATSEQVDVACSILTPTNSKKAQSNMYSAKAETIAQAIEKIELQLGKKLGFAQCDVVAVGENLLNLGVVRAFDYLIRTKKVARNVFLVNFDCKCEDFVNATIFMENNLSLQLDNLIQSNKEYTLGVDSDLETFYMGYYGEQSLSLIPKVTVRDDDTLGGIEIKDESSSSSDSSAGIGGNGEEEKKKYFVNDGSVSVLKYGKKYYNISPIESKKINFMNSEAVTGSFRVEHITDDIFDDATVILNMENKISRIDYDFEGDTPIIKVNLNMYFRIEEIIEKARNEKLNVREDELFTETVKAKLEEKIESEIREAFELMKSKNMDLLDFYSYFNKFHYKKWEKHTKENPENYLNGCEIKTELNVVQYI